MDKDRTDASPATITVARQADAAENSEAAFLAPVHPGLAQTPPPALLLALDRAAKFAAELELRRLSVRFEAGADNRMQAQVVDPEGNVIRRLPVAQALELLNGGGASQLGTQA
jgi:hypothetical protein